MKHSSKPVMVALLFEKSLEYHRGFCEGVWAFGREHGWRILDRAMGYGFPVEAWRGKLDGIIGMTKDRSLEPLARERSAHLVTFGTPSPQDLTHTVVQADHHALVKLGIQEFLRLGLKTLCFCGAKDQLAAEIRADHFRSLMNEQGLKPHVFHQAPLFWGHPERWQQNQRALRRWVKSLPLPCGILVTEDRRAVELSHTISGLGIEVPRQIALLSINDERVMCESCDVPVSSIALPAYDYGMRSAALLQNLIAGGSPPPSPIRISEAEIHRRASTDIIHLGDPLVENVLLKIRREAPGRPMTVDQLLEGVYLSRRAFFTRFTSAVGHSPKVEMDRVRCERACELLADPGRSIKEITRDMGFETTNVFSRFFRRMMNQSPTEYRQNLSGESD